MRFLLAGSLLAVGFTSSSLMQEEVIISRPANAPFDEATWERLRNGFAQEKQLFLELLGQLDKNRVDLVLDTPSSVLAKRKLIRAALDTNAKATVEGMAPVGALILNVVQLRNETGPRLSGRILKVGDGGEVAKLRDAIAQIKKGDVVQLGPGTHGLGLAMGGQLEFEDVAFVGEGQDKTTLILDGRTMRGPKPWRRVRIENLKIDCKDNNFMDLRGGSIQIKNCHVFNYNSGAGGSNAIFATNSVLLIEESTFEGDSGRSSGRSGGCAFDLREDNLLFARNCRFVDNQQIVRATSPCGFDGCVSESSIEHSYGIVPYDKGLVLLRGNKATVQRHELTAEFSRTTDDPEFIEYVCGDRKDADDATRKLAEDLAIDRNLPYWIGLIRHDKPNIRAKAAARIEALTGRKVSAREAGRLLTADELEQAVRDLDDEALEKRAAATETLKKAGESVRKRLLSLAEKGTEEQKSRVKSLLDSLDHEAKWRPELEFADLMTWLEENRAKLKWDDKLGRYVSGQ